MKLILKVFYESIVQAFQQLISNKLRSFLSLLGITIGIFCIIAVQSAVDSLEANISQSFDKLGKDVVYVDRFPWNEDPHSNYWKYIRRPRPDYTDLMAIANRVQTAEMASLSVFIPGKTIKYQSSHVRGAYMAGVTYDYGAIYNLSIESGRYFTPYEYETGANKLILGHVLAENLFPTGQAVGKIVKVMGRKFQVIGVLEKEGNSLINVIPYDEAVLISYNTAKKLVNIRTGTAWGSLINVKARPNVTMTDLKDEVTGVLRSHRRLQPKEDSDFAVNELSIFTNLLRPIFSVMNIVGWCIGIFAILVGMFSVANIMFVSVRERTNIIGIKKAIGAPRNVILLEFLIESVILCVFGGILGLLLVMGGLKLVARFFAYELFLSTGNIALGIGLAVIIGVLSGLIPALQAARMDPVEAIRHK